MENKKNAPEGMQLCLCILQQQTRAVLGKPCSYTLAASHDGFVQYYIKIVFENESCAACVGASRSGAERLFAMVVQGVVTPCTLPDILCDLQGG